jgi:hypothetical protein
MATPVTLVPMRQPVPFVAAYPSLTGPQVQMVRPVSAYPAQPVMGGYPTIGGGTAYPALTVPTAAPSYGAYG